MRVEAKRVDSSSELSAAGPGAFAFNGSPDAPKPSIFYNCPCGCGERWYLPLCRGTANEKVSNRWLWNGDPDRPDVRPSVLLQMGDGKGGLVEHWHGYLKAGFWESV